MRLEVRLLGPPSISRDGGPVRLHSAKTLALLTYLSVEAGRPHSREKLASLLWGESTETRAKQSLRQALYSLRRTLPPEALTSEAATVLLHPHPDLWTDAARFCDLAARSERTPTRDVLTHAADTYRGTLLEGSAPTGCPAFSEWLFYQRDRLEQQALAVFEELVDLLASTGNHDAALAYADRLLSLDPLNEGAFRRLMWLHGAGGDRNAVRRLYKLCADSLDRELGVEPDDETQALYERLMAERPMAPDPAPETPDRAAGKLVELPFLGRDREMRQLAEQYRLAQNGQGRLVLVAGEAGIGKSRLVEAFLARSAVTSTAAAQFVLRGRCFEAELDTPYTVWADALQALAQPVSGTQLDGVADVWLRQLGRLVPDLGTAASQVDALGPDESRLLLMQAVVRVVRHLASQSPVIVWLDDIHWADGPSLATLSYAARHLSGHRALLICTYRPGAGRTNDALGALERGSPQPERIAVSPLALDAVEEIVTSLPGGPDHSLAVRLLQHSDGNPLVLTETVQALLGTPEPVGRDVPPHDRVDTWPVPDRIQALVQARLAKLARVTQRVLGASAVLGRPYGTVLLRRVSGVTEGEAVEAIGQALQRGFLVEQSGVGPSPTLAFRHSYYRRAVYQGLSGVQRQALHARAGRALLEAHQATPEAVVEQVADHLDRAADPDAADYLAAAAHQAEALYADRHATRLYTRAVAALGTHRPTDYGGLFELLLDRERLLDRQGLRAEQADDVAKLRRTAEALDDSGRMALALVREAGLLSATGRHGEAGVAGARALTIYRQTGDTTGEGRALRELGYASWSGGDHSAALAYMRDALELHRRLGNTEGEATALHNLAEIHRSLGSPRQAIGLYESALRLYWSRQDKVRQSISLYGLANAYRDTGGVEQALGHLAEALSLCEETGHRLMASRVHHAVAGLHLAQGDTSGALHGMERAVTISREIGYGPGIAHGLVALSDLHDRSGRQELAERVMAEAAEWLDLTGGATARTSLATEDLGLAQPPRPIGADGQERWVRTHLRFAEGKVYCAFESPAAHTGSCRRS